MSDQRHTTDGLMIWLADQFGGIQLKLGEMHAQTMTNRSTVIQVYHQLTHRMDRMEDRIARNGNGHHKNRYGWLKHIPWVKITLLLIGAGLVMTGHLTVAEIKGYMAKRLLD